MDPKKQTILLKASQLVWGVVTESCLQKKTCVLKQKNDEFQSLLSDARNNVSVPTNIFQKTCSTAIQLKVNLIFLPSHIYVC